MDGWGWRTPHEPAAPCGEDEGGSPDAVGGCELVQVAR